MLVVGKRCVPAVPLTDLICAIKRPWRKTNTNFGGRLAVQYLPARCKIRIYHLPVPSMVFPSPTPILFPISSSSGAVLSLSSQEVEESLSGVSRIERPTKSVPPRYYQGTGGKTQSLTLIERIPTQSKILSLLLHLNGRVSMIR